MGVPVSWIKKKNIGPGRYASGFMIIDSSGYGIRFERYLSNIDIQHENKLGRTWRASIWDYASNCEVDINHYRLMDQNMDSLIQEDMIYVEMIINFKKMK